MSPFERQTRLAYRDREGLGDNGQVLEHYRHFARMDLTG
jgi:hypothetical protein